MTGYLSGGYVTVDIVGPLIFNNNSLMQWEDSGGTARTVLVLNGSNNLILSNDATGNITLQTDNATGVGNLTTRLLVRAGGAQGATRIEVYEPLTFTATMTGLATATQIYSVATADDLRLNVPTGKTVNLLVNGALILTVGGNNVVIQSGIGFQIENSAGTAADVLDVSTNDLIFSNDWTGTISIRTDNASGAGNLTERILIGAGTVQGSGSITFQEPLTCNENVNLASGKKVQENSVNISPIGKHDLYIPAAAMWGSTTNGATAATIETGATVKNVKVLDFDQTTVESAEFSMALPRNYNNGTILARFYWTATAGSAAETVAWGIEGVALSDDDVLTAAFGTRVDTSDALIATSDMHVSAQSTAVTIGGTPADADYLHFKVTRQTGSDNLAADARLIGVSIEFSTDAAVAA